MSGPDRTPHARAARLNPLAHVILAPQTTPSRPTTKHAPRPSNAWILYRQWALVRLLNDHPELKGQPQSELSKKISTLWRNETPDVRQHFEHMSNLQKEKHAQDHPDYTFKPVKKADKQRARELAKQEKARAKEADKLRKEIEKALRAGHLPMGITIDASGDAPAQGIAGHNSALHKLTLSCFSELGPSPPMSLCPSREGTPPPQPTGGEPLNSAPRATTDDSPLDGSASTEAVPVQSASVDLSNISTDAAPQLTGPFLHLTAMAWQSDAAMAHDASRASSSALSDGVVDWPSDDTFNLVTGDPDAPLNEWIDPSFSQDQLDPAGNLTFSIDHAGGDKQLDNGFATCGQIFGIQLDTMPNLMGGQFDCDLANPYQEQPAAGSLAVAAPAHYSNEAAFLQPFFPSEDLSLEDLLAVGEDLDDALLDEVELREHGARVIAVEHIQDGAPAMALESYSASAYLPSPPETAPAISPPVGAAFDVEISMQPTNLAASGSNQQALGGLGFEDTMPITDMGASNFGELGLDDFGFGDAFGFGDSMMPDMGSSGFNYSAFDFGYDNAMFPSNVGFSDTTFGFDDAMLPPDFGTSGSAPRLNAPTEPLTPLSAGSVTEFGQGSMEDYLMSSYIPSGDAADAAQSHANEGWLPDAYSEPLGAS